MNTGASAKPDVGTDCSVVRRSWQVDRYYSYALDLKFR
jgi:hypothetical protein